MNNNYFKMNINDYKPKKIVWGFPDKVEMTDKDGVVHTYSIIEILDALQDYARRRKEDAADDAVTFGLI